MRKAIASRAATLISVLTALLDGEALEAGALGAELADGAWLVEGTNAGPRRPEEGLERAGPPPVSGAAAIVDLQPVNS